MHEYEFEVEAVIDAEIDTVFNAILDVNSYHNWFPGVEIRVRGGEKILHRGSVMEVLTKSNHFITLRFSEEVVDLEKNKSMQKEFIEGDSRPRKIDNRRKVILCH